MKLIDILKTLVSIIVPGTQNAFEVWVLICYGLAISSMLSTSINLYCDDGNCWIEERVRRLSCKLLATWVVLQ